MKALGGHPAHSAITDEMKAAVQARYDFSRQTSMNSAQQKKGKKGKGKGQQQGGWQQQPGTQWVPKNDGRGNPPAAGSAAAAVQASRQLSQQLYPYANSQLYPSIPQPQMYPNLYLPGKGNEVAQSLTQPQYPALSGLQPQTGYTDVHFQMDQFAIQNTNLPPSAIAAAKSRIKLFLDSQGGAGKAPE